MKTVPREVGFVVVWLLLVLWAGVVTFYPDGNIDIWLHLRVGAEVAARGVPHVDAWSATALGRPFVAHEWLAGVLFKSVTDRAGGVGLVLLRAWISSLLALSLWLSAPRALRNRPLSFVLAACVLLIVLPRAVARPHLFSLLFFALHVVALEEWRRRQSWLALAWLPPLVALWANLHGAFVLGPALLFTAGAAAVVAVRFPALRGELGPTRYRDASVPLVVAAASLLCGLLNPYGAELYAFSLQMAFENAYLKALVNEWKTLLAPEHRGSHETALFFALALAACAGIIRNWRRVGVVEMALLAFALLLGLRAFRFLPYFALLSFPILVRGLTEPTAENGSAREAASTATGWRPLVFASLVPALLLGVTLVRGPGFSTTLRYPFRAELAMHPAANMVARARQLGLSGPVLNEYEMGGFLLYAAPELKPAIDARIDIYGPALVEEWQRALSDPRAARDYTERYGMRIAMLYQHRSDVVSALRADGWRVAFEDDTHVMLLRE